MVEPARPSTSTPDASEVRLPANAYTRLAAGDTYVPRVLTPRSGASQRFVASPGHEGTGILHMPGGQSGHPFSPHFDDQQRAWVDGTPVPLQPGETLHTLTFTP